MFSVSGYIGGVSYAAQVGAPPADSDGKRQIGCVTGDPGVIAWLRGQAGEPWQATPTGPSGTTDLDDPVSVYGTLLHGTHVSGTAGDVPDLTGPVRAGTVY